VTSVVADLVPFPKALQRALDVYPAGLADRADSALRSCLRERLASDERRAWTSSSLTGSGFPVELTFTTGDDRLRYTVEPGFPDQAPRDRFETALRLVEQLSGAVVPDDWCGAWREAQRHQALRFGAWIGGRHGGGDGIQPLDDAYKLYVELPGDVTPGPERFTFPIPHLPDRVPSPRMVAFIPGSAQIEAYYRISSLAPYHLPRVLAPCGLETRAGEMLDVLTEAYGHALRERLPGGSVGVSYAMTGSAEPRSVTLFFFGRVFWGGDARIRERFGALSRAMGWDDERYQRITEPIGSRRTCATQHGIFGVTLTRDGQCHLSIGVRPPEISTERDQGTS
jgi:hypothetical protein